MKATPTKKKSPAKGEVKENSFPVVAIGASAGGLEAMMELLKYLPADTGMAFIYVQHLSPDHKSMLTEILSKKTSMKVQEIDDMDKIMPDNVFVIPYNKGIEVTDGHIKLIPRSESSTAISIDILFSSLAEAQKKRVIGIILSGSASDGTIGMKTIKHEGGLTFAQDDTAKFTSMPHSAIAAGVVDFILSPKEIALELERLSKHPLIKSAKSETKKNNEDLINNNNPDLKIILNQLHKVTGVDFSAYKMNTIKRRIIRRMLLYKVATLKEYAKLLTKKNEEIDILYQDLLINVTSFFRDTETHKYLKTTLFPKLLKRKKEGEWLRIWIPACATGEEAFSIAMMLLEIQESKTSTTPVQIFATDLSEQAINKARDGIYTPQDLETVSPKRVQRFFTKADGGFRINKTVREMCVFAQHNILRDPPFSRLDFISCCNLFIYLDTAAQKKAINTFHYALNNDGFLMLGKSENISQSTNLFTCANSKYKIFSRKINSGSQRLPELTPRFAQQNTVGEKNVALRQRSKTQINVSATQQGLDNYIDDVLISEFMPASVVINHHMEIVQFRGTTDLFLTHPKGKATFNILKMARPEIAFELRTTISKVIKTNEGIRKTGIELKINSDIKIISIEIVPLEIDWNEPLLLIIFTEHEQAEFFSSQANNGKNNSVAKDRRIKKLEQELAAAHADALSIAQEQEAFTEELQSAHEEVVSSNEELQTVNEELETSKEEIESANEELSTTNQELQTRNDLLNEAYHYSEAVFSTIHEPMVVLDKNLRVKSANKTFYKTYNTKVEDTEGMLLYEIGHKQWDIPRLKELLEEILPKNSQFHDFEITHTFPEIGKKTMVLNARRIIQKSNHEELILLAIADITEKVLSLHKMEKNEIKLIEAKAAAENAVKYKQQFLANMSHEIRTPLNSILGFANVLLKTKLGVKQREFAQAIKTSGTSLNQLINDILDLARVDAGRMTFNNEPIEILKSLKSLIYSFDLKIKEKNIELTIDYDSKIPLMLLGDSVRLNQIILNLLSNAIKFTHNGKIILSVKLLNEDDENVTIEFTVADTGIGIPADKIDTIFNVFEQAEPGTASSYGGTGLGLAIVKQLIEGQGGSISLKSKLGEGSRFSFTLPFGKTKMNPEEETEKPKPDSGSEIKTLRVLVAEDVALNQLLIQIILSDFGFEHEIVSNGKMAIEKLQTNTYDIILMDLQMPEMNGFEATEYIRKTMKSQIPIIALTANVITADISKCKEFGMNDYVSKPINENILYNKIVELLRKQNKKP